MIMSVKEFDSLTKRDFDNGAVRDAIRRSLQELERISDHIATRIEIEENRKPYREQP